MDFNNGFSSDDFEMLRETLKKHLFHLIPGNDRDAIFNLIHDVRLHAAQLADKALKQALDQAKTVYSDQLGENWDQWTEYGDGDTHQGKIVCIEKIEK